MNKQTFLSELRKRLAGLPKKELDERLAFYSEAIDDRIEDGLTEEQAVAGIGSLDEVVEQIMSEVRLPSLVKEKVKPKRSLMAWEIVLLVVTFPIWVLLLFVVLVVLLSIYIVMLAFATALWVFNLATVCCGLAFFFTMFVYLFHGNILGFIALFGMALVASGVAILMFFVCKYATKGAFVLSKRILLKIKLSFVGKKGES